MAEQIRWNGDAMRRKIEAELGKRLDASAIVVLNQVRTLLSVEGTGKVGTGKRAKLIYGANPSRPGEPPRVQTGRLRASMAWEREGFVARVGTSVKYSVPLEFGTNRMAARPFLHRALNEMTPRINAILSRPIDF